METSILYVCEECGQLKNGPEDCGPVCPECAKDLEHFEAQRIRQEEYWEELVAIPSCHC